MAHLAKFKQPALGNMFAHYEHKKKRDNVDPKRTELNYNLANDLQPLKPLDFIHERLQGVKIQKRKDINYLCDWCITMPKDVRPDDQDKFFRACFNFLGNRYGKQNIVSAWIHLDETSPHMHFAYLPIAINRKGNPPEKLSAKEVNNRRDLQTFHFDLNKAITKALGYEVSLLNEATKEGNKTITELKQQTELQKQKDYIDKTNKVLAECNTRTSKALQDLRGIISQVDGYKALKNDLQGKIEDLQNIHQDTMDQIRELANDYDLYNRCLRTSILSGDSQKAEEYKDLIIDAQEAQEILEQFGYRDIPDYEIDR